MIKFCFKVKDAFPNETSDKPTIGNSFKVTIKTKDPAQSRFVFENLNTVFKNETVDAYESSKTVNHPCKNKTFIRNEERLNEVSESQLNPKKDELCIADFSRNINFNDTCLEPTKLISNISYTNSNNSTIVINSLSPASSSSLSNTSLRGSFKNSNSIDSKFLPFTTSSSHLSASNTIKFILSSQIVDTNQPDKSNNILF